MVGEKDYNSSSLIFFVYLSFGRDNEVIFNKKLSFPQGAATPPPHAQS
jgi:hypothetical protein